MNRLLSESEVWAAFRGQKHDLFLPAGGPPDAGVAGLLQVCEVISHNRLIAVSNSARRVARKLTRMAPC